MLAPYFLVLSTDPNFKQPHGVRCSSCLKIGRLQWGIAKMTKSKGNANDHEASIHTSKSVGSGIRSDFCYSNCGLA